MSTSKEQTALESLSTTQKVLEIQRALDSAIDNKIFDAHDGKISSEQITEQCKTYLDTLTKEGVIMNARVDKSSNTYIGWTKLYPKLSKRILAFLLYKITKRSEYSEQRWFHTVFPFKVSHYVEEFDHYWTMYADRGLWNEDKTEEQNLAEARERYIDELQVQYSAVLPVPYTDTSVSIWIQPNRPVEYITCSVTITPKGAEFKQ